MRGLQLRARSGLRSGHGHWLLPPWIAPAFLICAVVLLPWATFLIVTLPRNYTANHWRVAWGGFDLGLGVAMIATALAVAQIALRRGRCRCDGNAPRLRRLVRRAHDSG
ncbi:MAG: hypothetical protein H0W90_08420 [Actinobacteria bacterium]|nr:hypothetical protein [Actinomycetota bacterium]